MHALFNPKAYFHFLNVNFPLSAFYELLNSTGTSCADPGIFVRGGPGQATKKVVVFCFFFSPQLI